MTHFARSRLDVKGVDAPTNGTPVYTVEIVERAVRRPGPLWVRVRRTRDGSEWTVPVFSQGGAPFIPAGIGGDGGSADPPPKNALGAIAEAFRDVWTSDPGMLMFAGFAEGVRYPHKPGARRDSPEMLAVRVRRMLSERDRRSTRRGKTAADPLTSVKVALDTRQPWSNTERDVLKRAGREGVYADGKLTVWGEQLVERVDRAKVAIHDEVVRSVDVSRDALEAGLSASEWCVEAALFDLEQDGALTSRLRACASCGQKHRYLHAGEAKHGATPPPN